MTTEKAFRWPEGKRAALTFTFDDARLSQAEVGIPLLDSLGVRGTFYVMMSSVEKRLPVWRKAVETGHEIGNHTMSHPCTGNFVWSRKNPLEDYTLERMAEELDEANEAIKSTLGVTAKTFAYPCGQTFVGRGRDLKSYIPLVAERFIMGRTFRPEALPDPAFCDLAQFAGFDGDCQPFEALKGYIDRALEAGGWMVVVAHDVGTGGRQTMLVESLKQACRYALDHKDGVWLDTAAKVGEYVQKQQK